MKLSLPVTAVRLLLASILLTSTAFAWGPFGHEATALVAWDELPQGTKTKINGILAASTDIYGSRTGAAGLEYAAIWPDIIKARSRSEENPQNEPLHIFDALHARFANTASQLHYSDIDAQGNIVTKQGKNAVLAIPICVAVLKNSQSTARQKGEALAYLTHLVGDTHQPLHSGNPEDGGGNDITHLRMPKYPFVIEHPPSELHAVWDGYIFQTTDIDDVQEYYDQRLKQKVSGLLAKAQDSDPTHWAHESNQLAKTKAYLNENGVAIKVGDTLTTQYMSNGLAVVDERVVVGGIRLARLLEEALK